MIVSAVESQSTAGLTATGTSTVSAGSSDTTGLIARQPPIGIDIETAAATNPTQLSKFSTGKSPTLKHLGV